MRAFLVCSRPDDAPMAERLSRAARALAAREGYVVRDLSARAWIAEAGPLPLPLVEHEGWTVVGDAFPRHGPTERLVGRDGSDVGALHDTVWGRYVALKLTSDGRVADVFRDPSGALDCLVWTAHGLDFIGSDAPAWLVRGVQPSWRIAFDRIGAALDNPLLATAALLLDGPEAVLPGELRSLATGSVASVWRPRDSAVRPLRLDDSAAARLLQDTVDAAVEALAGASGRIAAEVSGGFDSSVVAACLTRAGAARPRLWLNAYGLDPAADERHYVDALAKKIKIAPACVPRTDAPLTEAWLGLMPHGVRPSLAALDGPHDQDWSDRMRGADIQSLFTGKGGDGLFIQPMTSAVFTDLWRDRGAAAVLDPALSAVARRTERSVWTLLKSAIGARPVTAPRDATPVDLIAPYDPSPPHPWLLDLDGLGPAKIHQILGVVHGQTVYGRSLKTRWVDAVHPLLSQPVVDLCLALPTYQLTLGRRDRALARRAFADRLPGVIVSRRSKGELSGYFGRMIADGLDAVRPWLLEGRLAAEGIINRESFDLLLRRESLAWRGGYVEILTAAAFEGWVRAWEDRLRPVSTSDRS